MTALDAITELFLATFRLNGRLLAAGDALVADIGLTSARWQVLGAIALSPVPLPVAHIARNMGLTRQAVQRLVNDMARDELVRFASNPHHKRAQLVLLTARGMDVYGAAMGRQRPWAKEIARDLTVKQIADATAVLQSLQQRLATAAGRSVIDA